jgi:hypothetical protein
MNPMMGGGNKAPSGYNMGRVQNFNPQQMQLFKQLFSHVGPESYLSRLAGGDQSTFGEMEAPAMRQFAQLQGQTASRFSGMGTGGSHSTGFQNTMTQGASDFAQDLQSRRQELQRQAIMDLMDISSSLLGQRPSETFFAPKPQRSGSFFENLMSGLGGGLGMVGGMFGGRGLFR